MLNGAIYVKHPDIGREGMDFRLTAGKVTFRSETPTIMRVDLQEEEGTVSVAVHKGDVLVTTASDNAWLHSGERADVMQTGVIEGPRSILFTDRDEFDEWNEEQALRLARVGLSSSYTEPSPAAGPDLADLDGHGDWVSVASYGRVWQPRVVTGWRPYFYGEWVWTSPDGWMWVSAEPWGWLPYHYGQWTWDSFYGWVWIPGRVWAPAWVIWTPYQGGWAWAPYGPYGWPVALQISFQINYWCWTQEVGGGGHHHHRHATTLPKEMGKPSPGDGHRPPAYQPPRRDPSKPGVDHDARRRSEQQATLKPWPGANNRRPVREARVTGRPVMTPRPVRPAEPRDGGRIERPAPSITDRRATGSRPAPRPDPRPSDGAKIDRPRSEPPPAKVFVDRNVGQQSGQHDERRVGRPAPSSRFQRPTHSPMEQPHRNGGSSPPAVRPPERVGQAPTSPDRAAPSDPQRADGGSPGGPARPGR
jgi:hypothetical protein